MNFQTHSDAKINVDGTRWQGDVAASVAKLRYWLGEPMFNNTEKSAEEWQVCFADGVVITVYRPWYYAGSGSVPTPLHECDPHTRSWAVGGIDRRAIARLVEIFAGDHDHVSQRKEAA